MFELIPFARGARYFTAYDPFKEMEELEKCFFGRQAPTFKTDIRETESAYVIDAELPGFEKEEISVDIKDNVLTINAEHKEESKVDGEARYLSRERTYGSYTRRFELNGIHTEGIEAEYKNGILSVTLPKEEVKGRRLEIK